MWQPDLSARVAVDIQVWLRRLGLEQYSRAVRDNHIDAEVVPELTAEEPRWGIKPTPAIERAAEVTTKQAQEGTSSSASGAERRRARIYRAPSPPTARGPRNRLDFWLSSRP